MLHDLLRVTSTAIALLGGMALAGAQQPTPPPEPQQQPQQEKAQENPSGKAGTTEPSARAPSSMPRDTAVLVNGALAVPGAAADSDTVPAKFSAQNAADDKVIITAYTFRNLSDEQRQAIYQALKDQSAGAAFNADIGTQLPAAVELRQLPGDVTTRVPQTASYQYAVADNRVLLVSPSSRVVVGVFPDVKALEAGEGRRGN